MRLLFFTGVLLIVTLYIHECICKKYHNVKSPEERRQILVKNIISKMTNLSLYSFINASPKETPKIMNNLRTKLKLASNSTGSHVGDRYVELVMDGIQSIVSSKNKAGVIDSAINTNVIESHDLDIEKKEILRTGKENYYSSEELGPYENAIFGEDTCDCSCVEEKLCLKISSLDKFPCHTDRAIIPLLKVCDGEKDCTDNSDELQCVHVNTKLSVAKRTIYEIQDILPKYCLEVQNSVDKVVMKTRNNTLNKVLQTQLNFLNVVSPLNFQDFNEKPIKEVNEIALIVNSVATALEGALCIRDKPKTASNRRDGSSLDDNLDAIINNIQKPWAPPLCICADQSCLQNNCTPACNNTCWQRYTLKQWSCSAVSGADFVSLDHICDGKVDCEDESDENGCTSGAAADKFEATQLYNIIIEVLATQIKSASSPKMHKIINLQEAVKNLQAQSTLEDPDFAIVKRWRDEAFSGLFSIFDETLAKSHNVLEVNTAHDFLMSVGHKLVEAMKRSKTGNGGLISSSECHCVGDKCLLAECTEVCVRYCAVKATFTEYACKGVSRVSIPVRNICNRKKECPEGDDEEKCVLEVCRNHHLLMLRNNIQNYKNDRGGHTLEEVLDIWKTKTIATIRATEAMKGTTRLGLQQLVGETLLDLMQAYAALPGPTRRSPGATLNPFLDLARVIQDALRSCYV